MELACVRAHVKGNKEEGPKGLQRKISEAAVVEMSEPPILVPVFLYIPALDFGVS